MDAIDVLLAGQTDREHQRQAEDQPEWGRRRASTEVRLSNALDRVGRGTYLYGESPTADLANTWGDLDAGALFSPGTASQYDVMAEMQYQLGNRPGLPPARERRQPLPPVQGLAARIGLR